MTNETVRLTRGAAIRAKCLDCCCGSAHEVRLCTCVKCPLHRFRLGKEDKTGYYTTADADDENDEDANDFDERE